MRTILLTIVGALCLGSPSVVGQRAPNLAGTWVMDTTRSISAVSAHVAVDGRDEAVPEVWVIQQTNDALIVERRRGDVSQVVTYSFHARPALPQPQLHHDDRQRDVARGISVEDPPAVIGTQVQDTRAEVKGDGIVTKTVLTVNGKSVTTDETLRLSDDGHELIVERLLQVHHGYERSTPARTDATSAAHDEIGQDIFTRAR